MQEQYIKIDEYGNKLYYKDRKMTMLHRLDGPAVEYSDGSKVWYVDSKRHRLDGPAYDGAYGYKTWYVDGEQLTEREFNDLSAPTLELTLEDIAAKYNVDVKTLKIVK